MDVHYFSYKLFLGNYDKLNKVLLTYRKDNLPILNEPPEYIATVEFVAQNFKFKVPSYHILARQFIKFPNKMYTGSRLAFDFLYILCDTNSMYHERFFARVASESTFISNIIPYLPDMVKLANMYEIRELHEYIRRIFTLYKLNAPLYHVRFDNFDSKHRSDEKVFEDVLIRFKELTAIDFDVGDELKKIIESKQSNYMEELLSKTTRQSSSVFKGKRVELMHIMDKVSKELFERSLPESELKMDIHEFIATFADNKMFKANSRFLLSTVNFWGFQPKKLSSIKEKYLPLKSMELPMDLKKLIDFNLLLASMDSH